MAYYTFEAGRLLCGQIRNFLESQKFTGRDIDFIESTGFFTRKFTVKGNDKDVLVIKKALDLWADDNGMTEDQ